MKRTAILVLTVAALVLTVAALGVAGPGGAVAQTAAQDQYSAAPAPYSAAPDPYSDGVAVSPPVPSSAQQTTQYLAQRLQQLLYTQQTAAHLEQLLAQAAPPAGQVGVSRSDFYAQLVADAELKHQSIEDLAAASGNFDVLGQLVRDRCSLSAQTLGNTPDSMTDPNIIGNDQADIRAGCGPSSVTSNPMFP